MRYNTFTVGANSNWTNNWNFLIWFWTVYNLIPSKRKYTYVWACHARYPNSFDPISSGGQKTTYAWCRIYSVQWPIIIPQLRNFNLIDRVQYLQLPTCATLCVPQAVFTFTNVKLIITTYTHLTLYSHATPDKASQILVWLGDVTSPKGLWLHIIKTYTILLSRVHHCVETH